MGASLSYIFCLLLLYGEIFPHLCVRKARLNDCIIHLPVLGNELVP